MQKYTVVTTFHEAGLKLYGQSMIDSFEKYWPDSVDLLVYTENCTPTKTKDNVKFLDLVKEVPDLTVFKEKWEDSEKIKRKKLETNKKWFLWDAIRFCHKVYAMTHAGVTYDTDWLIWLDSDLITFAPVDDRLLKATCPNDIYCSYLGRPRTYSETGWITFNCNHKDHVNFMNFMKNTYDSGDLFNLKHWLDCEIFDHTRRHFEKSGMKNLDLTPSMFKNMKNEHVFINSILGEYMDHLKGGRKKTGKSQDKDQRLNKDIGYWKTVRKT